MFTPAPTPVESPDIQLTVERTGRIPLGAARTEHLRAREWGSDDGSATFRIGNISVDCAGRIERATMLQDQCSVTGFRLPKRLVGRNIRAVNVRVNRGARRLGETRSLNCREPITNDAVLKTLIFNIATHVRQTLSLKEKTRDGVRGTSVDIEFIY